MHAASNTSNTSQTSQRWNDRAASDFLTAVVVVGCGGVLFVSTDSVERLLPILVRWEKAQLDDLLLTLWLAVAVTGWFSLRRWRDSMSQVAELHRSAAERALYLTRLEELSTQLLDAEERERNRIADLLHDEVGQTLFACQLKLHLLSRLLSDGEARALHQEASELAAAAMARARELSMQLSPPELHDLGIEDAILAMLPRLQQRYALRMQLTPSEAWQRIPRRWYGPVFHSIKELLLNAAKHAAASSVCMSAEHDADGQVRVIVADDGSGFEIASGKPRGFGLFSVERRMACMNGRLEIHSQPNRGTTATLLLRSSG